MNFRMKRMRTIILCLSVNLLLAQRDPGPRTAPVPPWNGATKGLSAAELTNFQQGLEAFSEVDDVAAGLGPRFNLDSCAGCHSQPIVGGTSPAINPQIAVATKMGAQNKIPNFLQLDGPVRVVRIQRSLSGVPDGGVHNLFVITGRTDAPAACKIKQPDFSFTSSLSFRIPTPTFGLGLIEAITDRTLRANLALLQDRKRPLGIQGRFNTNSNDGTITRFGWKAQNTLGIFSGEAYNVEVGVTNDLFPLEREDDPNCLTTASPDSRPNLDSGSRSDIELFTLFMRYLAPPQAAAATETSDRGRQLFDAVGCALCHTPMLPGGKSATAALSDQRVNLYSDLALHRMGQNLNDGINQGLAQGNDFRTAPLWGLGSRLFFLHDGRTNNLAEAIRLHSGQGSEANLVVRNYDAIMDSQKQDILNFLRSL